MADELQTDLIVRAIAEGFEKLSGEIDEPGAASERTTKKISGMDKAMQAANKAVNGMKTALGGAKIALAFVEQAFTFASASAEKLGRVDVATNINEAQQALSGLTDVLVQIPIGGRDFLQWMGDGAAGIANFAKMVGAFGIQVQLTLGIIDRETAIMQINALVTDEVAAAKENAAIATAQLKVQNDLLAAGLSGPISKAYDDYRAVLDDSTLKIATAQSEIDYLRGKMYDSAESADEARRRVGELTLGISELKDKSSDAQEKMNRLTNEFIYQKAAAELDADAALELARSMGLIDEASYSAAIAIQDMRAKYDLNRDGAIDAAEAAKGYLREIENIAQTRISLQNRVIYTTFVNETVASADEINFARRQYGGAFTAGGAYFINESRTTAPEVVVVNPSGQGGQVLTNQQAAAYNKSLNIGSINVASPMDRAQVGAMIRDWLRG